MKAVELMGASPTPMAFGEVYTSLQTGVIDGYEHDASTTLQQRFYEVAHYMARTRHIAGVLGLFASTASLARLPADLRATLERGGASRPPAISARMGPQRGCAATTELAARGMTIREIDGAAFRMRPNGSGRREARALGVEPWLDGHPRMTDRRPPSLHAAPSLAGRSRCSSPRRRCRRRSSGRRPSRPATAHSRGPRKSRACCSSG